MNLDIVALGRLIPSSPLLFGVLIAIATGCLWMAIAPVGAVRPERQRMNDYVWRPEDDEEELMSEPFVRRALLPMLRRGLRLLGRLVPSRAMAATQRLLIQAGEPGHLTVLDYYGLQLLSALLLGGLGVLIIQRQGINRNSLMMGGVFIVLGLYMPHFWLRQKVDGRKKEIERAMPNAMDMLTIGVEAGLAFESAMLRVAERWDNALTQEFRRVVLEMRVGTSRDVALLHMTERTDVPDLRTFVAVLVQSSQLGVSIAEVLHSQAAMMREKRRQRAEAMARQATVKMAFPLVFFIFPAIFVVILGPAVPQLINMFGAMGGGG
ncbi:MAG: type II secretion system F family protein [Chloroflexi bacterium]|jgi:tight adherence protein C|nr:type II secretion system F family protein [Chloroflexota bacterium]